MGLLGFGFVGAQRASPGCCQEHPRCSHGPDRPSPGPAAGVGKNPPISCQLSDGEPRSEFPCSWRAFFALRSCISWDALAGKHVPLMVRSLRSALGPAGGGRIPALV